MVKKRSVIRKFTEFDKSLLTFVRFLCLSHVEKAGRQANKLEFNLFSFFLLIVLIFIEYVIVLIRSLARKYAYCKENNPAAARSCFIYYAIRDRRA